MGDAQFLLHHRQRTMREHLNLGLQKAVSYLPITTVEKVLGITVDEYQQMIERVGNKSAVFSSAESCIKSGAVYAYDSVSLQTILDHYGDLLSACNWPVTPDEFIRKIATSWYEESDPVIPVIRAVFGEATTTNTKK